MIHSSFLSFVLDSAHLSREAAAAAPPSEWFDAFAARCAVELCDKTRSYMGHDSFHIWHMTGLHI